MEVMARERGELHVTKILNSGPPKRHHSIMTVNKRWVKHFSFFSFFQSCLLFFFVFVFFKGRVIVISFWMLVFWYYIVSWSQQMRNIDRYECHPSVYQLFPNLLGYLSLHLSLSFRISIYFFLCIFLSPLSLSASGEINWWLSCLAELVCKPAFFISKACFFTTYSFIWQHPPTPTPPSFSSHSIYPSLRWLGSYQ